MHRESTSAMLKLGRTLSRINIYVKRVMNKLDVKMLGVFAILCSTTLASATPARAEDANARTVMNATNVLNYLGGVIPEGLPYVLKNLSNGTIKRIAPEQPIWVLDADAGVILYYQGQPSFAMKEASQLVDDAGQRFGQKAIENAKVARNTWLTIVLDSMAYGAYCANKYPYVVCSLKPAGSAIPQKPVTAATVSASN